MNTQIKLKADDINSTFWWRMLLDEKLPNYAAKSGERILLHGYSKIKDKRERKDKTELLLKNVIFLIKNYSFKSKWITIHAKDPNPDKAINKELELNGGDPTIIIINQNEPPIITAAGKATISADLQQFIQKLWKEDKAGIDINIYKPL